MKLTKSKLDQLITEELHEQVTGGVSTQKKPAFRFGNWLDDLIWQMGGGPLTGTPRPAKPSEKYKCVTQNDGSIRCGTPSGFEKRAAEEAARERKRTGIAATINWTPDMIVGDPEHIKKYNVQPGEKLVYAEPGGNVTYTYGEPWTPPSGPISSPKPWLIKEHAKDYVWGVKNPKRVANQYAVKKLKQIIREELNELVNYIGRRGNALTQLKAPPADMPADASLGADETSFDGVAEDLRTMALENAQQITNIESGVDPSIMAKRLLWFALKKLEESDTSI